MRVLTRRSTPSWLGAMAAALGWAVVPALALAQDTPEITLTDLKTPSSPAFVILGIEPSTVSRPTTPRALALELLSRTEHANVLPRDYALEFSPYWLRSRPELTFDQYISPSTAQALQQSFSISVATKASIEGSDSVTSLGLGFRLTPFAGHLTTRTRQAIQRLDSLHGVRIDTLNRREEYGDSITSVIDSLATARTEPVNQASVAALTARLGELQREQTRIDSVLDAQQSGMADAAQAIQDGDQERYGWVLQLAGALAQRYVGNTFEGGEIGGFGAWGTVSYRWESPRIEFLTLGRFLRNESDDSQNLLDAGGRLIWMKDRLALSYEAVSRTSFDSDVEFPPGEVSGVIRFRSSARHSGLIEYQATDDLYVTGSFGKNFKRESDSKSPIIAMLGLQWNWGDKPTLVRD